MTQTTKRALEASLKNMLMKKPLSKITINDIAEDCGVSRMTVYYHFKDIYDLLEWVCEEDARKAMAGRKTYTTWQEGFLQLLEAVLQNKTIVMNVYRSESREQIENYLYKVTFHLLIDVVNEEAENMTVSEGDRAFIADFYKYAFVGLTLDWIKGGMKETPQSIIDRLLPLVQGNFQKALQAYDRRIN